MCDIRDRRIAIALTLTTVLAAAGCATVAKIGTQMAQGSGAISEEQGDSLNRVIDAADRTFRDITPEQEHFIGRAVAATLLQTYTPWDNAVANAYVNTLGQTLAMASDRPATFGGYHFLLLDSGEVNAFAAPGGFILVTRGMVRLCRSEDALAAVLAHEIAHVAGKHGLRAIKSSRLTSLFAIGLAEGLRNVGDEDLKDLVDDLEGSVTDVVGTLVSSGYSRELESEADAGALATLEQVGYNRRALVDMLGQMDRQLQPGDLGFGKTHPDPADRIAEIRPLLTGEPPLDEPAPRHARFAVAVGGA